MVYFDVRFAAKFMGVSSATIRNWIKTGVLGAHPHNSGKIPILEIYALQSKIESGEIDRLNQRANKSASKKTITPNEYIPKELVGLVQQIIDICDDAELPVSGAMYSTAIAYLIYCNEIALSDNDAKNQIRMSFRRSGIKKLILKWEDACQSEKQYATIAAISQAFAGQSVPKEQDFLGAIYQAMLQEGNKSQKGSYFTPINVVQDMIESQYQPGMRFLDPCCGTGQFLVCCARQKGCNYNDLYGIDIDQTSTYIASINLLLAFPDADFEPNIYHCNTLTDIDLDSFLDEYIWMKNAFDLIATNPPWGAALNRQELSKLYPEVQSGESFSYFVVKCRDFLKEGGRLSLVLPESIINIKVHKDIRKYILGNYQIASINELGAIFTDVFTNVYRMDLTRTATGKDTENTSNTILNKIFELTNYSFMSICNSEANELIDKFFAQEYITLKDNADWALGIVTGNNQKYLSDVMKVGFEPIYRGKDVLPMHLGTPAQFIDFKPVSFQQVAPEWKYRAKEKLIYRFISDKLVFAHDTQGVLTLNSANICIPKIAGMDMRSIAALFNSKVYNYLFKVLFNTHKVLKSNLEVLPIPIDFLDGDSKIMKIIKAEFKGGVRNCALDEYLMNYFKLTPREKETIWKMKI